MGERLSGEITIDDLKTGCDFPQSLDHGRRQLPAADLFNQKVEGTAWRSKPSWYIVATRDRTVQPELERFLAKRMEAMAYEVESSHVPMLSKPRFVLDVIREAARGTRNLRLLDQGGSRRAKLGSVRGTGRRAPRFKYPQSYGRGNCNTIRLMAHDGRPMHERCAQ